MENKLALIIAFPFVIIIGVLTGIFFSAFIYIALFVAVISMLGKYLFSIKFGKIK